MNVLVVSHTYCAPINRDKWKTLAQLYPHDTISVIFPRHWPTHLFTHNVTHEASDNMDNCTFTAFNVKRAGNEVLYAYHIKDLYRHLRTFRPDIIHVEQGDNALSYFQLIMLNKILRLKARMVFFTWINWEPPYSYKYTLLWKWIEYINRKCSSGAIVGNQEAKRLLQEKNFTQPILTLPQLGVNQDIFTINQQKISTKTIGFLGRFVPEKGINLLIEAFAHLHQKHPGWKLKLVGRGPDEASIKNNIHERNLHNHVSIIPPVSHHEIAAMLHTIDIMVLPSYDTPCWKEQFGHIIIEAMACGIPVIGSSAGEIPYVIENAGLVFEQKNVKSLKDCLEKLILHEDQHITLRQKGIERVTQHYSHQAIAQKTHTFWEQLFS